MKKSQTNNGNPRRDGMFPYIGFGALGIILLLVSGILFLCEKEPWSGLMLNLGASVLVVVIVELMWRKFFGGDPITRAIASLYSAITELGEMRSAGITSVKIERHELEGVENVELWCHLLANATEVDLMAFTLSRQVTRSIKVMAAIERTISSNLCRVRVLTFRPFTDLSEPDSVALRRIYEESLLPEGAGTKDKFRGALEQTRKQFEIIRQKFANDPERKECLKLASTDQVTMYINTIRIDDRMWISPYLSSAKGGDSPVFEINGTQTPLFKLFYKEFEHMWNHAKPS